MADSAAVAKALNRLAARGRDMRPVMRDIGEHLLRTTRERFEKERQGSPDGTPWERIGEAWNQRKRRLRHGADRILTFCGDLRGTLAYARGFEPG